MNPTQSYKPFNIQKQSNLYYGPEPQANCKAYLKEDQKNT